MRGLASFTRSTALSNGMDAQRSAGVLLSSPAAAQRCAEGAGLDSGAPAEAQSAMPSIALPCSAPTAHGYPPTPAAPMAPQLQPRISTSLTDVTAIDGPGGNTTPTKDGMIAEFQRANAEPRRNATRHWYGAAETTLTGSLRRFVTGD